MGAGTVAALVGRAPEREALMAALADSRARPGGILVIEGEPGIGKSRLVLELARIGDEEGCLVLIARASEFERDLPYALFREAMNATWAKWVSAGCNCWAPPTRMRSWRSRRRWARPRTCGPSET